MKIEKGYSGCVGIMLQTAGSSLHFYTVQLRIDISAGKFPLSHWEGEGLIERIQIDLEEED